MTMYNLILYAQFLSGLGDAGSGNFLKRILIF